MEGLRGKKNWHPVGFIAREKDAKINLESMKGGRKISDNNLCTQLIISTLVLKDPHLPGPAAQALRAQVLGDNWELSVGF